MCQIKNELHRESDLDKDNNKGIKTKLHAYCKENKTTNLEVSVKNLACQLNLIDPMSLDARTLFHDYRSSLQDLACSAKLAYEEFVFNNPVHYIKENTHKRKMI